MNTPAEWTWMVYLAGDNDLSMAGDTDLEEMRAAGSSPAVHVVAQFDNAGDQGTTRFRVERDGRDEAPIDLGETDSGSPAALIDFVQWAVTEYPAQRYALILWNHGNGWAPTEMDRIARAVGATNYTGREAEERASSTLRRAFFRSTLARIFQLPSPAERAICSDDGSGHSLDTVELGQVLDAVTTAIGCPLDLLGMDACLMSTLEVAYQARPYARLLVGSEELEPADGWPYEPILRRLLEEPELPTAELASYIVDSYVGYYAEQHYSGDVTQSALDLSQIGAVTAPLDTLASVLAAHMDVTAPEIWMAQRKSTRFYHNTLWDLGHFCAELAARTSVETVRQAAQAVVAALQPGPGRFVAATARRGAALRGSMGVSIYLPVLTKVSPYYAELDFAQTHGWPALLDAYTRT